VKIVSKLVLTALFGFTILATTVDAGIVKKGQMIYVKKIKGQCTGKTAGAFAATFTQKEWENAFKIGEFKVKVKEICPSMESYNEKWTPYLFEFAYEYASDTDKEYAC
jgi:hypothetical protein